MMSILSAKNYVSYLQIMPDAEKEELILQELHQQQQASR
jgi:hypothetical protein